MSKRPLFTRHDRPGTEDPELLAILADAEARAGQAFGEHLAVMYNHDGQLLATWRGKAARKDFAPALTAAWHAANIGGSVLNLVPTDENYDYQEDVMDNPVD